MLKLTEWKWTAKFDNPLFPLCHNQIFRLFVSCLGVWSATLSLYLFMVIAYLFT